MANEPQPSAAPESAKPADKANAISSGQLPVTEVSAAKSNPAAGEVAKPLTAEEQMALYEKDLKENDWGHQPC